MWNRAGIVALWDAVVRDREGIVSASSQDHMGSCKDRKHPFSGSCGILWGSYPFAEVGVGNRAGIMPL